MSATMFAPGSRVVVRDEEWIVRSVRKTDTGGLAVSVTGLSELVRNKPAIFLTELDSPKELTPETTQLVHDPSPRYRRSRLYLESLFRKTPPTDSKLYIGHRAAMNPAPYQLVPAHKALQQPRPRILIADAVGLGKTLEVGVLLSELIQRGRGDRILVVALKSILTQFQEEMWARFTIPLVRLDSVGIQRVQAKIPSNMNPFYYFDRVIISIDTLKKDEKYRRYLDECHWDAIVVDECQHVAVRGKHGKKSQRARLATLLARNCDSLILTSATPHDGSPESFASLMNLLEPTAVADESNYTKDEIQGLFVRRFKKDVAASMGTSFSEREITPHHIQASGAENTVFETLSKLDFQTIDNKGRRGGVLFRTTLLKAFLSSPAACEATVLARLKKLEDKTGPEAEADHDALQNLLAQIRRIDNFKKLEKLFALLDELGYNGRSPDRAVIFSERIDTLKFLQEQLSKRYDLKEEQIGLFYGSLDDQQQQALVKDFGTAKGKVKILLGSDAASEGINLHYYCHRMIHFDIPWSLITLEQRNGRIDRFGQEETPDIRYLLTVPGDETLKGDLRILDRLVEKEHNAHQNLGDVAWLMNLHDAEKEEERIGKAIENREAPEDVVPDEPAQTGVFDFLALLEESPENETDEEHDVVTCDPLSLYPSDVAYAREAFDELGNVEVEWHDHFRGFTVQAPEDLKIRYEYLPPELRRNSRHEIQLSADREHIQKCLVDSRQEEDQWPEWELFWNQHPLAEWLNDKVLANFQRHEAPVLQVRGLGQPTYVFQGVVSNFRSQPVLISWFGVQGEKIITMAELHTLLSPTLTNPGDRFEPGPLNQALPSAIQAARNHMEDERQRRGRELGGLVRNDKRRIVAWEQKKRKSFQALNSGATLSAPERRRLEREKDDVERRVKAWETWFQEAVKTSPNVYLRVAAVLL
jgi:SNF2 family DNA or RNA helicase